MTDKNLTEIVAIIDRSGSMGNLTKETIGGYNNFLAEQKKIGKTLVTLVQFDDHYQIDYEGVDINDAKLLDETSYVPRGMTALFDAVGKTIVAVGERLAKMDEDKRPGQVIFLIITDGAENSSKEYREHGKVQQMVKHQTDNYSWTFVFMGGGDLSIQQAQASAMGIPAANSYNYSANSIGTSNVYGTVSRGVSRRKMDLINDVAVAAAAPVLTSDEAESLVTPK